MKFLGIFIGAVCACVLFSASGAVANEEDEVIPLRLNNIREILVFCLVLLVLIFTFAFYETKRCCLLHVLYFVGALALSLFCSHSRQMSNVNGHSS